MHTCSRCNITQPNSEFYYRTKMVNGVLREYRQSPCKECCRESNRKIRTCPICNTTWKRIGGSVRGNILCDTCRPEIKYCRLCEQYKSRKNDFKGRRGACEDCYPEYSRMTLYGLKKGEYKKMHDYQNGACAICLTPNENLYVDHDHETGEVRGLLCTTCNTGIGYMKDCTENLTRAIEYLQERPASSALKRA